MTAVFRLGLAGAGRMGRTHLRALSASDRVRVTAIADPSDTARAELDGPGMSVFAELGAMLDAGGIDGLLIASPSPLHLGLVEQAANAGLPILCEKPCGITAAEARDRGRLRRLARRSAADRLLASLLAHAAQAQAAHRDGELGDIAFLACYQWDERPPTPAFRAKSGGIFIDMGVHEFDQLRWLTGQDIVSLRVVAGGLASAPPVEGDPESAQVLCELSAGTTGLVSLGRSFPLGDICRAEVFGSKAVEDCRFLWPPNADAAFMQALLLQAEAFADRVGGKLSDGATATDAVAALEAAEQASELYRANA